MGCTTSKTGASGNGVDFTDDKIAEGRQSRFGAKSFAFLRFMLLQLPMTATSSHRMASLTRMAKRR